MKKTIKRTIALVLTFVMLMSMGVAGISVFAAEETTAPVEDYVANEENKSLAGVIIQFFLEGFYFLKYIFYDLWLGKAPA